MLNKESNHIGMSLHGLHGAYRSACTYEVKCIQAVRSSIYGFLNRWSWALIRRQGWPGWTQLSDPDCGVQRGNLDLCDNDRGEPSSFRGTASPSMPKDPEPNDSADRSAEHQDRISLDAPSSPTRAVRHVLLAIDTCPDAPTRRCGSPAPRRGYYSLGFSNRAG